MPESWEVKLSQFYKFLENKEKSLKETPASEESPAEEKPAVQPRVAAPQPGAQPSVQSSPVATAEPEPAAPAAVKPWPPAIPGLPKREPEPAQPSAPRTVPDGSGLPHSAPPPTQQPISALTAGPAVKEEPPAEQLDLNIPKLEDYLPFLREPAEKPDSKAPASAAPRKPVAERAVPAAQHAPSARVVQPKPSIPTSATEIQQAWDRLPKHIQMLMGSFPKDAAQRYYTKKFKESRDNLIQRLLDPPLTLEETARVLNVCPMTVRRYTNRGVLPHFRTVGNQRRFRLSDVLGFLESRTGIGETQEGAANA